MMQGPEPRQNDVAQMTGGGWGPPPGGAPPGGGGYGPPPGGGGGGYGPPGGGGYGPPPGGAPPGGGGYGPPPGGFGPPPGGFGPPPMGAPYGMQQAGPAGIDPMTGQPLSDKSKMVAGLLQILVPIGIGRFYTGHIGIGIAQLLTAVFCGVGAIWCIIDGVMMLTGKVPDAQGRALRD